MLEACQSWRRAKAGGVPRLEACQGWRLAVRKSTIQYQASVTTGTVT